MWSKTFVTDGEGKLAHHDVITAEQFDCLEMATAGWYTFAVVLHTIVLDSGDQDKRRLRKKYQLWKGKFLNK